MRPFFALMLILACGSLQAQEPISAREWVNRGVAAFKQGQYQDAVSAFTKAVQADPNLTTAHLYLGTAYMQMYIPGAESADNNATAAAAHTEFQKVLSADASNKPALMSEASLYLNQKQWDSATLAYQKVIANDPNNADAYYSLGFLAWSQWYPPYTKARMAAGMKMEDPGPIRNTGIRQDLKAKWDAVLQDGILSLQKALTIRPDYSDAMAYMNLLIRERADLHDTEAEWRSDITVADDWVHKALEAKRVQAQKQGGLSNGGTLTAAPPPPPPPPPPPGTGGGGGSRAQQGVTWDPQTNGPHLLTRVDPIYPALAIQAKVQGVVVVRFVVGSDGRTRNLQVVSGHPLLIPAAIDAVKQWVYAPELRNGQAVEVPVTVSIPFTLPQ